MTKNPTSNSVDELDDMVYVSDKEDNESSAKAEPGMIPAVKNLYPGEKAEYGRYITTDKVPEDLPEPEETEETGRYALLIRNNKCYDGRKSLRIASIVIQSPLLKKVLCWVLKDYPGMAPELDRLEVVSPFHPFVHRWQRLTDALNDERDPETKSHIQLFYDALKKELEVILEARDDFISHEAITFISLWMLFEPGDIVYTIVNRRPVAAKLKTSTSFRGRNEDVYLLECEMIYGNGNMFGWGQPRFEIPEFDGLMKITDLCVYPLKYHQKLDKIKQQLIDNGKAYERLMGFHHKQYQGVALDGHQPFYIDSRIIVDPDGYKRYFPGHDMVLKPLKNHSTNDESLEESDVSSEDSKATEKKVMPALTDDQLMLCGWSVKGYSLRNKCWLDLFVDKIKDIEWDERAWDNVVLESELKDLVFSLTSGHRRNHKGLQSKGLNILLSGPTGTGKTFTVKSVAEVLHAPLFHVTPADVDLDTKSPDLESPFTGILEMCGRWNAILVFDQQTQGALDDQLDDDQGREYSLLLDALESHSSALFVTCNAVAEDCLDQRLLSRFHVDVQIPELTSATREHIWRKCLESQKDYSYFVNANILADWRLNGREIANAVTAAMTLTTNGVIEMKDLERVVSVSKKPIPVLDDFWSDVPKKDKKKSKKSAVDTVGQQTVKAIQAAEELLMKKSNEDDWNSYDAGTKKEKKSKKKASVEPNTIAQTPTPQEPDCFVQDDPKMDPEDDEGFWGSSGRNNEEKMSEELLEGIIQEEIQAAENAPLPSPPMKYEVPSKQDVNEDDLWSFGRMNRKKAKKASVERAVIEPPPAPKQPCPFVQDDVKVVTEEVGDTWSSFGLKKKKGKKAKESFSVYTEKDLEHIDDGDEARLTEVGIPDVKVSRKPSMELVSPLPPSVWEGPVRDRFDEDCRWRCNSKKEKKTKKVTAKALEQFSPPTVEEESTEAVAAPPEVDEWHS
ncbi:MAG: hypothetical protein Q9188_005386 [Gyalolechia gomerana]